MTQVSAPVGLRKVGVTWPAGSQVQVPGDRRRGRQETGGGGQQTGAVGPGVLLETGLVRSQEPSDRRREGQFGWEFAKI